MPSWVSKPHTHCRVCGEKLDKPYLDLGEQPLANALVPDPTREPANPATWPELFGTEQRFPLQVILCEQCGLSQLSVVVNPEILYAGYRFRSGQSEAWVTHCEELAKRCTDDLSLAPSMVLDIAANDGTQLAAFEKQGWFTRGVDPSPAGNDWRIERGFWNERLASEWAIKGYRADLVIAQNVLGHVDDPISFLKAIKTVLAPEGRVVVEVPEWSASSSSFDTIYHEHLSYWSRAPMYEAGRLAGLGLEKTEELATHGGSIRYWFSHHSYAHSWHFLSEGRHAAFAQRVEENLNRASLLIAEEFPDKMLGWGASAKASVYLNALLRDAGETYLPSAIIDDCLEKQGLLLPGVHIPVIACPESLADVDVLWLLSWNNAPALKEKAKARGFRGKFLLTNGTPRLEE